jgi:acyl-ACP--UDP-N-acetylglucosamine O-acyltransferase
MTGPAAVTVVREIAPGARVDPDARVGPFCTIGPNVTIGPRTVLASHVTVVGHTIIGADNLIQSGCVLGQFPQDLKYRFEPTYLILGDRNVLGPRVTAHVGTEDGGYLTRIGHDNRLEEGAHVAHDCYIDDGTRLETKVLLAGHIRVENGVVIEEMAGVHHFSTIGLRARVGARTPVRRDVPPFTRFTSGGYYATAPAVVGTNEEDWPAELPDPYADRLRRAIERLFSDERALALKVEEMMTEAELPEPVRYLCHFCLRSLEGKFGRYRERYRGAMPPEARMHLPPEALRRIDAEETK